jgi:hypothetical protein
VYQGYQLIMKVRARKMMIWCFFRKANNASKAADAGREPVTLSSVSPWRDGPDPQER